MSSREQGGGTETSSLSSHTHVGTEFQHVKEEQRNITDPEKTPDVSPNAVSEEKPPRDIHGIKVSPANKTYKV